MQHVHEPASGPVAAIGLTHGAGGNCEGRLLQCVAERLAANGVLVIRYDLPFRESGRPGPPRPADQGKDRDGIRAIAARLRTMTSKPVFMAGHSYGGRQTTIAAAETAGLADGLMLMSYPLHPPGKPEQLRVAHFPELRVPCLFVHGTKDPFGTIAEMREHVRAIPASARIEEMEGAGHDLVKSRKYEAAAGKIVSAFLETFALR